MTDLHDSDPQSVIQLRQLLEKVGARQIPVDTFCHHYRYLADQNLDGVGLTYSRIYALRLVQLVVRERSTSTTRHVTPTGLDRDWVILVYAHAILSMPVRQPELSLSSYVDLINEYLLDRYDTDIFCRKFRDMVLSDDVPRPVPVAASIDALYHAAANCRGDDSRESAPDVETLLTQACSSTRQAIASWLEGGGDHAAAVPQEYDSIRLPE
jgi:hypothetical protein